MTTKTLDQIGKAGAYHQMTRRKAAIFDTGLDDYKDYSSTIMSLSLTAEGVFGSQFDEKLKSRQERFITIELVKGAFQLQRQEFYCKFLSCP